MNNKADPMEHLSEFEEKIVYTFKNKRNALLALTHSSYANENKNEKLSSNERSEFLGDAVLSLVITEEIYKKYTGLPEGEMTKARALIVCEQTLAKCANNIELGKYLLLGNGEAHTGGRTRPSILSDAFESLIAAIYIDGGISKARVFINNQMGYLIEDSINGIIFMDYKTQFQEIVQKNREEKITYEIIEEKGPDHNKIFVSCVKIGDTVVGTGEGKSKKEADQNAAKQALEKVL